MDKKIEELMALFEEIIYDFGRHSTNAIYSENISHGDFCALRTISRIDKCSMQDIAKSTGVTKGGATRMVKRFEEKKLVNRLRDRKDGRVCCVQLSERGKLLMTRLTEEPANKLAATFAAMDADMRQILLIGLRSFSKLRR